MRPDVVVVVSPECQLTTGVIQRIEDLLIQQFVAHAAVEAFNEAILHRLARRDVVPVDLAVLLPFQDGVESQLRPITPSE